MLELSGVRVTYGRVAAVHGIDLAVEAGEAVGMIGPNGAGKTSTLRAISGLVRPASGSILFEGKSIVGLAPEQIVRLGIALVPEGRHVFKTLTVAENLLLGAGSRKVPRARIDDVVSRFPILGERYLQPADRLSGGEQQQLAVARALVSRPKLLMLDEPSLGLAPQMIDLIYKTLTELAEEGATMLLVEQNAARTIEFCDRCLILSGGSIKVSGNREELQRSRDVVRAYLGGSAD